MVFHWRNMDHYRWTATGKFPECMEEWPNETPCMDSTRDSSEAPPCPVVLPRIVRANFFNIDIAFIAFTIVVLYLLRIPLLCCICCVYYHCIASTIAVLSLMSSIVV